MTLPPLPEPPDGAGAAGLPGPNATSTACRWDPLPQEGNSPASVPPALAAEAGGLAESVPERQPTRAESPPDLRGTPARPKGSQATPVEAGGEKEAAPDEGQKPEVTRKKKETWYSVHEQGTVVTQKHDAFRSPYEGANSLLPHEPAKTTETATLYLDARIWPGGELIFNPEISGGEGFSGTHGIAGFPNG